ncbi:MerR family transcriptional regulator [Halalkalibacter akibai]|uniref:Transcriptional activator tipA n=1 Tax=Halalkalibacter akibai (strain ATCC 43226 / DSM 21942 / CIP 109018 / JCM 9157 / 1139) TaxID=1236973 RepID=W4QNI3_HALA3|nr:MerR family transcriptional regulator [Halalkalibacter akibai]GAE33675.1 transcriptional activator tipA [Halalkalibacter akibai JCM 9157]
MKVKELADLVGISVRTLHYYDEIGLLSPKETTESGYRLYSDEDLELLQQILFFRELDFPLKEIKQIVRSSSFDRQEALIQHRKMLEKKRSQLDTLINTVNKSIQQMRGEVKMTNKERFEGFDFSHNPYEQEARKLWGDKAVDESKAKIASMSKEAQNAVSEIYSKLSLIRDRSPKSEEAQATIKEWFNCLNNNFGHYTLDAFKGLGQLYVADERFTKNIDQYGEGLAKFMCEAMEYFADQQKQQKC